MGTHRHLALGFLAAAFTDFDPAVASPILAPDYIQHNPGVPTGAEPVLQFIPALKASGIAVAIHRVLTDGNFVIVT